MVTITLSRLIFTCCGLLHLVRGQFTWPIIENDHIALAESVAILTRNYLSKASSTVVVLERSWKEEMRSQHSLVLGHILTNMGGVMAVQLNASQYNNQPWEYHIFVVDGIDSFVDIGWSFPYTDYDRNFYFLVVLTICTPDFMETVKEIFMSCRRFHVLNANVVLNHPVLGVCMYKYNVFSKEKCNEVQPYLYFCFKEGIHKLREVFPAKLVNYWGCPLRVTARLITPIVKFFGNRSNIVPQTDGHCLGGVEGDLLKIVSKTLNFSIHLVSLPADRSFYRNSSSNSCFEELLDGKADIAVGGFGASDPMRKLLSPSVVFHHSPIVFIVRQRMQIGSLSRLSWPFEGEVWILLALCLFIGSLTLYLLRLTNPEVQNFIVGYRNHAPVTNFIAVFLGYPMTHLPIRNFARYLLTVWLLMSLVIRNAYQGSLYDAFRTDRNMRIPKDHDELIKRDYKIFISQVFEGFDIYPLDRTITTGVGKIYRIKILEKKKGRYTTITGRDNFISYLEENYRNGSKLVMVKKPVFMHPSVFFFRKHSIYVGSFNRKLRTLIDAGITKRIHANNVKDYVLFRKRKKGSVTPEAIKFFRIKGIYDICGQMLMFAFFVFVLELLSVRFESLRNLLNLLS